MSSKTGSRKTNKNVSVSPLTRLDKQLIKSLKVEPKLPTRHGNSKAVCWNYFGTMKYKSGEKEVTLDSSRYYCLSCLTDVQSGSSDTSTCHISAVSNFSNQTSSGNLNMHLFNKHGIVTAKDDGETSKKLSNYFASYVKSDNTNGNRPIPNQHEFNRDVAIWFC